jgi:nitroreductase
MTALDFLNNRRSTPSRLLAEPGPDAAQLQQIMQASVRVPDHGKLVPWRLLLIRGQARERLGELLARQRQISEPGVGADALAKDRERFRHAPLIVAVIARPTAGHKVPLQEQLLSAGCVAYNLCLAAQALGFGAQWLTGWAAYDAAVARSLDLTGQEHIIAFVHIGTATESAPERPRPALSDVVSEWNGASAA